MSSDLHFTVLLVGLPSSGKTTWLKHLEFGELTEEYYPTHGFKSRSIILRSSCGPITLDILDVGGKPLPTDIAKHFYQQSDGIIFFGDYSKTTKNNEQCFEYYRQDLLNYHIRSNDINHVYVLNKIDIDNEQIDCGELEKTRNREMIQISVKNNLATILPLTSLVAQFLGDDCKITSVLGISPKPEPKSQISFKLALMRINENSRELTRLKSESMRRTKILLEGVWKR